MHTHLHVCTASVHVYTLAHSRTHTRMHTRTHTILVCSYDLRRCTLYQHPAVHIVATETTTLLFVSLPQRPRMGHCSYRCHRDHANHNTICMHIAPGTQCVVYRCIGFKGKSSNTGTTHCVLCYQLYIYIYLLYCARHTPVFIYTVRSSVTNRAHGVTVASPTTFSSVQFNSTLSINVIFGGVLLQTIQRSHWCSNLIIFGCCWFFCCWLFFFCPADVRETWFGPCVVAGRK